MASDAMSIGPTHLIRPDPARGIIRIEVAGFFDLDTLNAHFDENALVVAQWRGAGRAIRVLIDAIALMPHTPEGQACVQDATARIYRPGDRVAVLVSSALIRMQVRRALREGDVMEFFTSEAEARDWLFAG